LRQVETTGIAMNLSGIPRSTFVGRMLRSLLALIPSTAVFPVLQGRLRGRKWIVGSCDHGCWLGSYEYHKQHLFTRSITPGSTVYDIGAHSGFYTLLAAELVGPTGTVVSFESLPRNVGFLKKHVEMNRYENVRIIEAAVCDRDGTSLFQAADSNLMEHLSPTGELEVRAVSLDSLVREGAIPLPHCIKMDIEGGEYTALKGAQNVLTTFMPTIFLATPGRGVHRECCDLLMRTGYCLAAVNKDCEIENTDEILAYRPR